MDDGSLAQSRAELALSPSPNLAEHHEMSHSLNSLMGDI